MKDEVLRLRVSTDEKNEIARAARAMGMNVSDYIRSRTITHRASFPIHGENNEFYTLSSQGHVIDTRTYSPARSLTIEMRNKFITHDSENYHPDCVICQDKKQRIPIAETPYDDGSDCPSADPKYDPRTEQEKAFDEMDADNEDTMKSILGDM